MEVAQQQLEQLPVQLVEQLAGQVLLQGQVGPERLEWVGVH